MRKQIICVCSAAAALVAIDHVAADGALTLMESAWFAKAAGASVNRTHKADRAAAPIGGEPQRRIATIEIVGLENAAIVYRDRDGRLLFRTDPVDNVTIVVRGVVLPSVTVRETPGAPLRPVVVPPPESEPPAPKLLDGCEPAASPLSASGASTLRARCFALLDRGKREAL